MVLEVAAAGETLFILVLITFTLYCILFCVSAIGTLCYISGYYY